MPDFSPSFLLSGLIELSVPLPSDHPIYILFFVDIVTITNLFFIINYMKKYFTKEKILIRKKI